MTVERIRRALMGWRFDIESEATLQNQIENALKAARIEFVREKVLGPADRVDFLCAEGIALEIKIKGQARQVFRQITRYCEYPEVRTVLLATARSFRMPERVNGKPVHVVSLTRGLL